MTFESWNEPPNKSHQNIRAWKMQFQILEGKTLELDRDYVKFKKTCQTEKDWSTSFNSFCDTINYQRQTINARF